MSAKLKAVEAKLAKLQKETKQLQKLKEQLEQEQALEAVKKSGVVAGGHYKAIPTDRAGDVFEGKVLKVQKPKWGYGVQVLILVPAKGRYNERTVYLDLKHYQLEKVTKPSKVKTPAN
jgi:hypothetical protein